MFWYVFFGAFAAFGVLSALWVIGGVFLPGGCRCSTAVICPAKAEIAVIRRFCWLREMGLTRARLTILDSGLNAAQRRFIRRRYPYIHFCARQDWLCGQGEERKDIES